MNWHNTLLNLRIQDSIITYKMKDSVISKEDIEKSFSMCKESDIILSIKGGLPSPLTFREEEIIHLVNSEPNDMELGKKLRSLVKSLYNERR